MNHFEIAGEVIEAWVADNHPEDDAFRWLPRVPAGDWLYTRIGWRSAATVIVAAFNARIADPITVPASDKDALRLKEMQVFQNYLAHKADSAAAFASAKALIP